MILHHYRSSSGKDLILDYINSLPNDEQADGYCVLACLENGEMDKLSFKRWQKKIYEVYFYKDNRIFYAVADGSNIYFMLAESRKIKRKRKIRISL